MLFQTIFFVTSVSSAITRHANPSDYYFYRRRDSKVTTDGAKILDEHLTKEREYSDGIAHYRKQNLSIKDAEKATAIEKDFRRLLAMKGAKYVYKRNLHWRTWRKVKLENGVDKIVSYKCNNNLHKNLTGCDNCGLWNLEESPPCPVEIFSMINNAWLCIHDYLQPQEDYNDNCPTMMKFHDLPLTCDNPIETIFRFTSEFDTFGKYSNLLCGGKFFCEVFTTYLISKANITFKIIDSENKVVYSRIMKTNNINYICVNSCGRYDSKTKKVMKLGSPLKLNLLPSRKNKRDLVGLKREPDVNILIDNQLPMPNENARKIYNINTRPITFDTKELQYLTFYRFPKTTTESNCEKVKEQQRFYEEYYDNYQDDLL